MEPIAHCRQAAIYTGTVVHKRLRPKPHALDYKVYALLIDVDLIEATAAKLSLFSYNRPNVFALHDRDYGPGDGTPLSHHARAILDRAGLVHAGRRIEVLSYPRVLGYVFNPISVYFCYDRSDALAALIYEVSNTFSERKSYVVKAGQSSATGTYAQTCAKELFVSPFASGKGAYGFHVTPPVEDVTIGVNYRDTGGPLIKTHFHGQASQLTDAHLAGLLARYPAMTFKVIAAIHYEALKLWLKGVPVVQGHSSPRYSISTTDIRARG